MSDIISRQVAISAIYERWSRTENFDGWGADISEECEEVLKALPSADRPTGEWIPNNDGSWNCSKCGLRALTAKGDYCLSLCGAKMKGEPIIADIPSATRPTGEWEQVPYKRQGHEEVVTDGHSWRCSNCGDARKRNQPDMRFCPNCGVRMKGADDGKMA